MAPDCFIIVGFGLLAICTRCSSWERYEQRDCFEKQFNENLR